MADRRTVRVLLADDSEIVGTRVAELLRDTGAIELVGVARDVPEAISQFLARRPDAAVLDILMPGGSGIDVLERIRAVDPACVVIMLTTYANPELRQRCLDAGANFFLHKTTEFERVADLLKDLTHETR